MLTDEDLIRELEAGFRYETEELTYAGRVPTPRRAVVPWTAVPIAAATAAVIVLPQLGEGSGPTATPQPPARPRRSPAGGYATFGADPSAPASQGTVKLVTASFEFAGRTFQYQKPADEPQRYDHLPDRWCGAARRTPRRSQNPYDIEKAWSGTDPRTGDAAVWVQDSATTTTRRWRWTSPFFTEQELVTMLQTPPDQEQRF